MKNKIFQKTTINSDPSDISYSSNEEKRKATCLEGVLDDSCANLPSNHSINSNDFHVFDLNKFYYDEGELHANIQIQEVILQMLKIILPKFF